MLLTYTPETSDGALLSLLRLAYLATKRTTPLSAEAVGELNMQTLCELTERITYVYRVPISIVDSLEKHDGVVQIAESSVLAPTALLRLLTILAERGVLDSIPAWTTLPEGTLAGTDLRQVQQITSPAVLKKLLSLVLKRLVDRREKCRQFVTQDDLFYARAAYRQAAELAAAVVSFDRATKGVWRASVKGARKELVLSLGNAAEMSNRLGEHKRALVYALTARDVARDAPGIEGITQEIIAKNERRIETARSKLAVSLSLPCLSFPC